MRREAQFQTLFRHWLMANKGKFTNAAFELKQTTGDSLPYSALAEHQEAYLEAVQHPTQGVLYKIPDDSRGIKPFDFVYLKMAQSWIVIRFPKFFCVIEYDNFLGFKLLSKRKSITSEEARRISTHCVKIGSTR